MYFQKWFIPEQLLQLAEFALDSCFTGCGIDQTVFIAGFYITDFSYIKGIDIMRKRFRDGNDFFCPPFQLLNYRICQCRTLLGKTALSDKPKRLDLKGLKHQLLPA